MVRRKLISNSVKETVAFGARLGKKLKAGDIVALSGIFGAGKTYFTKGIARGLGVKNIDKVVSPSFVLGTVHHGKRYKLYHFDAHRLPDAAELLRLGFTDCFSNGVCVMEWAERMRELKAQPNVTIVYFKVTGKNKRLIKISGKKL
ncbi:MAG: tRNA (adenosine(37)-N6)-threonylcarbamoyltransferase complex ATPase subunit type 1 TsaE [Planctomycetes bacterium]|nr:tRNA (adenosine(37)-N6)-threonylcarbamoyltransferase complex ATPase subunit type 1 TsaE [Planctomycetota bacterium]